MTNRLPSPPRLLLLAHYCHPEMGSEPGLGWNRALQAAQLYPTWVLCDEDFNRAGIERYLQQPWTDREPALCVCAAEPLGKAASPRAGNFLCGVQPVASAGVQDRAAIARANAIRFGASGEFERLSRAGIFVEARCAVCLGAGGRGAKLSVAVSGRRRFEGCGQRSDSQRAQCAADSLLRRGSAMAARKAAAFLAATTTNAEALACRRGAMPAGDAGYRRAICTARFSGYANFDHGGPLRLMWSGVFEHRKALHLLLEALAALPSHVKYELHILGRGPLDRRWRRMAQRLNVEQHCRWLGWLDQEATRQENSVGGFVCIHQPARHVGHGGAGSVRRRHARALSGSSGDGGHRHRRVRRENPSDHAARGDCRLARRAGCGCTIIVRNWLRLSRGAIERAEHYSLGAPGPADGGSLSASAWKRTGLPQAER